MVELELADVAELVGAVKRMLAVGDNSSVHLSSLGAVSSRILAGKMALKRLLCAVGSWNADMHFFSQHAVQRSL